VDQEVAKTLGELEHKLRELERTLSSIDRDSGGGAAPSADAPSATAPATATGFGRTADTDSPPPHETRLVDEAVEELAAAGMGAAATAATNALPQGGAPSSAPSASADTPARAPAGSSAQPTASELLRFRDRLERTARALTHDYDELLGKLRLGRAPAHPGPPTISFARGAPSLDIVDVEGLKDAAARALQNDPGGATAYGTSVGYVPLRAWIADKHGVEPEHVLVTNGSMQADAFLFEHLVGPGDEVVVERPTYDRTLLSLRQRGARVHAVALEPDGIDTEALAQLLSAGAHVRPKLAHVIPNFQNPAGYTLSLAKRRALLALAAAHGFVVFEDDPYVALRFQGEALPTMLSLDPDRVVYASSFSKTVCPGIRVGYLVGPPDLIAAVAKLATNTYISPSMVAQAIVYEFCASGAIERSIETVRAALAERAHALGEALRRELPEAEFVAPEGGYFMWVTLPPGTDVNGLYSAAAERGVSFVKGTDFVLEGGENALRLAYAGVTVREIDVGVARLAAAYRWL
jgi:DNA-binding transcriptional MocR family regulator